MVDLRMREDDLVELKHTKRLATGFRGTLVDRAARRSAKAVLNPLLGAFRPGNIAMFHVGRVGSTVLTSMLKQSRRICWAGEILAPRHPRYQAELEAAGGSLDAVAFLRAMMCDARSRIFGFDTKILDEQQPLKSLQLSLEAYVDTLSALGFNRYIVIRRRNTLRQLISHNVVRLTKQKHLRTTEVANKNRITLDLERVQVGESYFELIDAIRLIERGYERLSLILPPDRVCTLTYEDDISEDPMVGYTKIMSFMGLPPERPEVVLQKTNPYPLVEILENFDEVETKLANTPYHWMVSE